MLNILFYKYVPLDNLEQLRVRHYSWCASQGMKGTLLLAPEGINGNLSGTEDQIKAFTAFLREDPRFSDVEFKIGYTTRHNFRRLSVKLKKEIVALRQEAAKIEHRAPYIEPKELKQILDNGQEVILVDARNNYESRIGRFKGAILPNIETFSEWPLVVEQLRECKNKPIVTYCTGGIRCERASSYLLEQGFSNVRQLHGGIIRYGLEAGDDHWEGKCFVFDNRVAINIDPHKKSPPVANCEHCGKPDDHYSHCNLTQCDRLFICCEECQKKLQGYCSELCRHELIRHEANRIGAR